MYVKVCTWLVKKSEKNANLVNRPYLVNIYIIKAGVCLFVCQHSNVRTLTSPPVLKLWGTQGYLWLPYDLTEVIKLIEERFEPKKYFFSKKYFMSFLPPYCHSFHITVIPSGLLSFLPYYCHSFRITVIPSELMSFLPNYCHFKYFSSWISPVPSHTRRARKMATGGAHICECR